MAACLALVVAPGAVAAAPAGAAPTTPSQAQVDAARRATADKASQVAAVQAQLADADAALEAAQVRAALAAETADAAAEELTTRTEAARSTATAAEQAQADADAARAAVGRLAAGSYRSGGGLDRVSAFLSADGPQDLLDRAALLDSVGARTDRAHERLRAAETVAALLRAQSDAALAEQQRAADDAAAARDAAQQAADAATAMVATTEQQRTALVGQLAQLQGISTALAAQRQAALTAEAQARADADARADRTRRQAAAGSAPGASRASGAASSGAASSGSSSATTGSGPSGPRSSSTGSSTGSSGSSGSAGAATGGTPTPAGSSSASSAQAAAALSWARTQIGDPYEWGASGPDSWDCSGLTSQAYRAAGVSLPRTSAQQYRAAQKISLDALRPGDLIFYGSDPDDWSTVYHVAVYAGGGRMVEAPRAGLDVRETAVRYAGTMAWAGRV